LPVIEKSNSGGEAQTILIKKMFLFKEPTNLQCYFNLY